MKATKLGLAALALLLAAASAEAATIAFERLEDLTCVDEDTCTDATVNLFRTRQNGGDPAVTEDSDALIALQNAIGADFGLHSLNDFSFTHDLTWLLPVSEFSDATLNIWAYDVNGGNDLIKIGTAELGPLVEGNGTITETEFATIQTHIVNNLLTVLVDKHPNGPQQDRINVFRSLLTVEYAEQVPGELPEPASLLLLGAGLAGLAARRRRKR